MELATITLRFDSPEEQKFVEQNIAYLTVEEHETLPAGYKHKSWTTFDASGCEPTDIQEALEEVMDNWMVEHQLD